MKNEVIESLEPGQGVQIIEYWRGRGVDVKRYCGINCKQLGAKNRYYGVINGVFKCYRIEEVQEVNAIIFDPFTKLEML